MSVVKQRWRLVFARGDEARYLSHLDAVHSWERAFRRGDIPVATSEGFSPRPKLVFAAPLQLGMLAEHELADIFLAEKLTAPDLRRRLAAGMPRGYSVVDLHDVWIGAPAIAPQLAAADYRLNLLNVEQELLAGAVTRLLAADQLTRERRKESKSIRYDLRPLVFDLQVRPVDPAAIPPDADPGLTAGLWMRLRHSQSGGSGRAEEVVAALADDLGLTANVALGDADEGGDAAAATPAETTDQSGPALEVIHPVRERLWLTEELRPTDPPAGDLRRHLES
jgi:radical SAM-linked protein